MASVLGRGRIFRNPLGVGGLKVFDWFFPTRTSQQMDGNADGETGVDDDVAEPRKPGSGLRFCDFNNQSSVSPLGGVPLIGAYLRVSSADDQEEYNVFQNHR